MSAQLEGERLQLARCRRKGLGYGVRVEEPVHDLAHRVDVRRALLPLRLGVFCRTACTSRSHTAMMVGHGETQLGRGVAIRGHVVAMAENGRDDTPD